MSNPMENAGLDLGGLLIVIAVSLIIFALFVFVAYKKLKRLTTRPLPSTSRTFGYQLRPDDYCSPTSVYVVHSDRERVVHDDDDDEIGTDNPAFSYTQFR